MPYGGSKGPRRKLRMEDLMEGGFINDRTGQATRRMREQMRRMGGKQVTPQEQKAPRQGNRTMRRFGK